MPTGLLSLLVMLASPWLSLLPSPTAGRDCAAAVQGLSPPPHVPEVRMG